MSGIESLWASSAVQAMAWALVHFLWQGALVGLAAAGTLSLLTRAKASVRYAVAAAALLVLLASPVLTAVWIGRDAPLPLPPAASAAVPATVAAVSGTAGLPVPVREALPAALPWMFGLWLTGVAALSVYHAGGWWQVRRLRQRGTRPVAAEWQARLRRLADRLGIARAVEILESSAVPVPAVVGWLRPVILVPASALTGLSPRQLEAILAHELAHVRRHDYLVNLSQTVVETLLFYHPAVWWVSAQIRRERENCCDDLAVAACGDRLVYARALADLELRRAPAARLAVAAAAGDRGALLARIRRLVGAPAQASRRSWLAGAVALCLLPGLAAVHLACGPGPGTAPAVADGQDEVLRTWSAERVGRDRISLEMKTRSGRNRWIQTSDHPAAELRGLFDGPGVRFALRRQAGTFHFEGRARSSRASGSFTFAPDPAYVRGLRDLGYEVSDSRLLELATLEVSLDFARQMKELGYDDETTDQLIQLRVHDLSPELIREIAGLGYRKLPADRLVELRIHGVTPEFVRGMVGAGYRLPPERLVELRIHGVTPALARGLADAGYSNLSPERLVEFHIFGVDGRFVRQAAARGYRNLSAAELLELRTVGSVARKR